MSSITKMCFVLRHLNKSLNDLRKPFVVNRFTRQSITSLSLFRRFCHNNSNSEDTNGRSSESVDNSRADIETIFLSPKVQTLLQRMTGFDDQKVFAIKPMIQKKTNEVRFMTDQELNLMLAMARNGAKERLLMPPVLKPREDKPKVLAKDYELQGYIDSKFIFVDSSSGYSDQTRLIVVREPNGVLREANREERYRMNQMFFPKEERLMEIPKMFFDPHFKEVLDRHEYEFVLERACLQFEPNDPHFIDVCHKTYEHIGANGQFSALESTRHFGPMAYYFAFNSKIDNLFKHFILSEDMNRASDLVKLYYIIHSNDSQLLSDIDSETIDSLHLVKKYINEESKEKPILELCLQKYEEIQREKLSSIEDIDRAHGMTQN